MLSALGTCPSCQRADPEVYGSGRTSDNHFAIWLRCHGCETLFDVIIEQVKISKLPPKPDCYKCRHRCNVVGSAHSECRHPSIVRSTSQEVLLRLLKDGRPSYRCDGIAVRGSPHGIKNGWFCWPFDFDPTWLIACSGFEEIASENRHK